MSFNKSTYGISVLNVSKLSYRLWMRCVALLAFTILIGIGWAFTDSFQDYADRRIVEYKIVDKGIAGGVNVWIHYTTAKAPNDIILKENIQRSEQELSNWHHYEIGSWYINRDRRLQFFEEYFILLFVVAVIVAIIAISNDLTYFSYLIFGIRPQTGGVRSNGLDTVGLSINVPRHDYKLPQVGTIECTILEVNKDDDNVVTLAFDVKNVDALGNNSGKFGIKAWEEIVADAANELHLLMPNGSKFRIKSIESLFNYVKSNCYGMPYQVATVTTNDNTISIKWENPTCFIKY